MLIFLPPSIVPLFAMVYSFDRPVGATGDVTELEYCSALHQTDAIGGIRKDFSIQDVDISLFLASRYGVKLSPEEVEERILEDLGSTDGFMDMMQLVSLLLIPILREQQEERNKMETNGDSSHIKDDLLLYTVEMMLHDVTGSRQPKQLTSRLIRQMFQAYGEEEMAEDDELVLQMLEAAGGGPGKRVLLDAKTFCRALTADVQAYDVESKNRLSTTWDDVMGGKNNGRIDKDGTQSSNESAPDDFIDPEKQADVTMNSTKSMEDGSKMEGDVDNVPTMYTAPQIDNAADTFRSKPLVFFMWSFFLLSFQIYLNQSLRRGIYDSFPKCQYNQRSRPIENAGAFFCTIGLSIVQWIITLIIMSLAGVLYFAIGGMGNDLKCTKPIYPLIGVAIMGLSASLPPFLRNEFTQPVRMSRSFLVYTTAILGTCAALLSLWHFVAMLIPKKANQIREWLKGVLVPQAVRSQARIKEAAAYKIDNLVANSLKIHSIKKQESVVPTHFGQALLNFAEVMPEYERVGGYFWTLKKIWDGTLSRREGVLFSGRIVSTNFLQLIVAVLILLVGIILIDRVGEEVDSKSAALNGLVEFLDSTLVFDPTGELLDQIKGATATVDGVNEYMVVTSLGTGVAIAVTAALFIAAMVIPSASSTILRFRSGVTPFVNDQKVYLLRLAPDQTAFLRGMMYWGSLFGSILLGLAWAVLVFLYQWPVTAAITQQLTASLLGALAVIGGHAVVVIYIRKASTSGFYRKRPLVANTVLLLRECGLVALTQSFVIFRVIRLLLTTIFYAGRIDSPFLYDSLGQVGKFRIDRAPYVFQVEILQHEAHRHPYIETLGAMYLLKLRNGRAFGTLAGSSWRLLFIYVLMPWLSKYRAVRRHPPEVEMEEGEEESGKGEPVAAPLRAVTLVDPQAYALRAVSLVPVASGWGGTSGRNLSVMSGRFAQGQEDVDDELRELREENDRLRMQLRLANLHPGAGVPNRARNRRSPEEPTEDVRRGKSTNSMGVEVDSRGRPISRSHGTQTKESTRTEIMVTISEDDNDDEPPTQHLQREKSEGLTTLRPPQPRTARDDAGPQISWSDFGEFDI